MDLKKLFRVLVIGGSAMVLTKCGPSTNTQNTQQGDGGTQGDGGPKFW